ncbi:hypothetical protein FEM41_01875 [Jejubacter calystegiae]|uniref:Uncharacterized protein n=1 Tax=Jejubacter calystegiae TaxID=2579935 RepID=A0A4P8YD55_9ENTR|nr:hypothetical protein [Jejubacter calystegiae]QCT18475.1 hypothetical protein FEM41_01875 [Jejubacter calystegiae]
MSKIITLALDGEAIQLADMKITATMQFQEKDQSGQTSSTDKAEQGVKAKELRISGLIPFSKPELLTRIFELGSAMDNAGKLHVYRVANMTAQAINLREVTFSGTIDAPQQDGQMAWLVTFTLREHLSVPEKKQARAAARTGAKTQGQTGAGASTTTTSTDADAEKMTWFERRVLKPTDEALGKLTGGSDAAA